MVERDIVQSFFLYEHSEYDFPFVFKGETSLSKAYKLIYRFSENIDLSYEEAIINGIKKYIILIFFRVLKRVILKKEI